MIKIVVDGQCLDMPKQPLSLHWVNFRFTDVLADRFSNDLVLPMSDRNIRLLDVWGLIDRDGQLFGEGVRCSIVTELGSSDGTLRVSGVTEEGIVATVYADALPSSLKAQVNRMVLDNTDTIVPWPVEAVEDVGNVRDVNVTGYDYGVDLWSSHEALFYPNVKVDYLLGRIEAQTGVLIERLSGVYPQDLRLLCTRRVVCPQNRLQNLLFVTANPLSGDEVATMTHGGQHVSNVKEGESLRFNRSATVEVKYTGRASGIASTGDITVRFETSVNDGASWTVRAWASYEDGEDYGDSFTFDAAEGMLFRVSSTATRTATGTVSVFCAMTVDGYAVTYDDYDTAMEVDVTPVPSWCGDPSLTYTYYGAMCNLEAMTVRELLNALAWKTGKRIQATAREIRWVEPDATEAIDARIQAVNYVTDRLGQRNQFQSADDVTLLAWSVDNEMLEAEKVVHKSLFLAVNDVTNSYGTMARVAQYEWKTEAEGIYRLEPVEVSHPVLVRCENYILRALTAVNTMGLRTLSRSVEIEAVTDADVSGLDYVTVGGHKLMLVDGDTDAESGLTTFKALLI